MTSEENWNGVVADAEQRWSKVDILINNAGVVHPAAIVDLKKSDFERVLGINLIGGWLGIKTVAPGMIARGGGAIVNICSTAGLWGMNGLAAYSSSKWALRGLTKTAAMELGLQGCSRQRDLSGRRQHADGQHHQRVGRRAQQVLPASADSSHRRTRRDRRTSLFLVSDDAAYICGAEVAVDGGMTIGVYNDFLPVVSGA